MGYHRAVGDHVPDFSLPSQSGGMFLLSDSKGKKIVVLYCFPQDGSPGCTQQARTLWDWYEGFTDAGVEAMGQSNRIIFSSEMIP
jgi:peroxiredoxin Q/BCP